MMRVRLSTLSVAIFTATLLLLLILMQDVLIAAHVDESIHYVASDAGTYYSHYYDTFIQSDLLDTPTLFLIGSPVLFMKLVDGKLWLIQICHLVLMSVSLLAAFKCLNTLRGRMWFMVGATAFPYFVFGFLSLNKEIYAMCAAIFFASYYLRNHRGHLLMALLLAACARYYMVLALLSAVILVPRTGPPRYILMLLLLLCISVAAPAAKVTIPEYSSENVLEGAGVTGIISAKIIDSYGYAIFYPFKYVLLIPMRAYGFLRGSDRAGDPMESVVSLLSLVVVLLAVHIVLFERIRDERVRRMILLAFVTPMPIMWSEIMHWRYYSFVYFFFLYAIILHYVEGRRPLPLPRLSINYA